MQVPSTFAAVSLLLGWVSFNAAYPIRRPGVLMLPSFFLGWLGAEFAIHRLIAQVLITIAFIVAGALQQWPGWVGLILMGLSWELLLRNVRVARTTRAILDSALESLPAIEHPPMSRGLMAVPIPVRHSDVEVVRNISFYKDQGIDLRLDLFRNRSRPTGCPTLVFVHGGAWIIGQKRFQGMPLIYRLASMGWVCVSIDYRLSPRATFPDHIIDVKRALRWVKEQGASYGADPEFVIIGGNSAGGHLAALAALTPDDPTYQPGFEQVDTSVQGCIAMYGVYDFLNRARTPAVDMTSGFLSRVVMKSSAIKERDAWDRASPTQRVTPDAPPFLVLHGDIDVLVPVGQARRFREAFQETARAPMYYAEIPGAQHAFDTFPSIRTAAVVDASARFVAHLRQLHLASKPAVERGLRVP